MKLSTKGRYAVMAMTDLASTRRLFPPGEGRAETAELRVIR